MQPKVLACSLALGAGALMARSPTVRAQDTNVYDFSNVAIDGALLQPDGALLQSTPVGPPSRDIEGELHELLRAIDTNGGPPAVRLRAAQLLLQRADQLFRTRMEAEEEMLLARRRRDPPTLARVERRRRALGERERRARERAFTQLDLITRNLHTPPSPVVVTALHTLMRLSGSPAYESTAHDAALRIIEDCPACAEVPEAHMHIGERAFAAASLALAQTHYLEALRSAPSTWIHGGYVHYKLGWTFFNLQRFDAAARELELAHATSTDPSLRNLPRQAARDLMLVLTHTSRSPAEVVHTIRRLVSSASEARGLAERYERTLRDQGRVPDADQFRQAWSAEAGGSGVRGSQP